MARSDLQRSVQAFDFDELGGGGSWRLRRDGLICRQRDEVGVSLAFTRIYHR